VIDGEEEAVKSTIGEPRPPPSLLFSSSPALPPHLRQVLPTHAAGHRYPAGGDLILHLGSRERVRGRERREGGRGGMGMSGMNRLASAACSIAPF